jgi:hypothetical protein
MSAPLGLVIKASFLEVSIPVSRLRAALFPSFQKLFQGALPLASRKGKASISQ